MAWSPLQLRKLALLGPGKPAAFLYFRPGVNVICGASDTGKSFIVEAIDFLLGGADPLRDIPERVAYDRSQISLATRDAQEFTFERSVEGGDYIIYEGIVGANQARKDGQRIKSKHAQGQVDNISGWLLSKVGLLNKQIKKNAQGVTNSLSFRDLARLIIVQENEIIKRSSPFLTGQYVTKTRELSTLKLLLTGVDDAAFVAERAVVKVGGEVTAKVELIDQWLADLQADVDDLRAGRNELREQLDRLNQSINFEQESLTRSQKNLTEATNARRALYMEREKNIDRISEIHELLERFTLLSRHYDIDIARLHAMQESGSLFAHQDRTSCPLCGALPEHQHMDKSCEGDVGEVVEAANIEIEKIKRLARELAQTVTELRHELEQLNGKVESLEKDFKVIDSELRDSISPDVGKGRAAFGELISERTEVTKALDLFHSIDRLEQQKNELLGEVEAKEAEKPSRTDLSKTVLDELAGHVERLLRAWHFPNADRVYFDEGTADFVIAGKPRGSRGKGLRAITHAAVTIGLMEYCKDKSLPHPGFVVLDSPLLSYWEPEGQEDSLEGTDLKDRFYGYLVEKHSESQIIVIENEHPSTSLLDQIAFTDFTKNPQIGRYGFFPLP